MNFVALAGALTLAGPALACSTDTPNEWECLTENTANPTAGPNLVDQGPQGPYTFSGTTTLKVNTFPLPITAICPLSLKGTVEIVSSTNTAYITVIDGEVGGTGTCTDLELQKFPWHATTNGNIGIPGASGGDVNPAYGSTTTADIDGISVYHDSLSTTLCEGTLSNVAFSNGNAAGDPSYFEFDGALPGSGQPFPCTIKGTLLSIDGDVDAW